MWLLSVFNGNMFLDSLDSKSKVTKKYVDLEFMSLEFPTFLIKKKMIDTLVIIRQENMNTINNYKSNCCGL